MIRRFKNDNHPFLSGILSKIRIVKMVIGIKSGYLTSVQKHPLREQTFRNFWFKFADFPPAASLVLNKTSHLAEAHTGIGMPD